MSKKETSGNQKQFVASDEAKGQAKQLRLFAIIAWLVAFGIQVYAILKLISDEMLVWLVAALVVMLILAVTGNLLWKKANRLDPATEENKFKFFVQSQLGAILSVLAFLPILLLILTNKDISGKTKGIAGAIAGVALLLGVGTGIDFNPPSIEKYTAETNMVEALTGQNLVYWTESGGKYHLTPECHHIKNRVKLYEGTVAEAKATKGITELCETCKKRYMKENDLSDESLETKIKQLEQAKESEDLEPLKEAS